MTRGRRNQADQAAFPGMDTARSRGQVLRAAAADLAALRAQDALIPDAKALEVTYRRLAEAIDRAHTGGESYTVGFLSQRLRECHAYLVGARTGPDEIADPFALSAAVIDATFT